jgi:hypothetical protein
MVHDIIFSSLTTFQFSSNKIYFPKEESSPDSSITVYIPGLLAKLLHPFHAKVGALETIHFEPVQGNIQIFRNAVTVRQQKHTYRCWIPLS